MSVKTCWFCDGKSNILEADFVEGTSADIRLELSKTKKRLIFDGLCLDDFDGVGAEFVINYCPICGRRL